MNETDKSLSNVLNIRQTVNTHLHTSPFGGAPPSTCLKFAKILQTVLHHMTADSTEILQKISRKVLAHK